MKKLFYFCKSKHLFCSVSMTQRNHRRSHSERLGDLSKSFLRGFRRKPSRYDCSSFLTTRNIYENEADIRTEVACFCRLLITLRINVSS